MKKKSDLDRDAKKTLANLEASSAEKSTDPKLHQLGQLVRESAAAELPPADPELRQTLLAKLEGILVPDLLPNSGKQAKKPLAPGKRRVGRILALATAASLALVVGGWLWMANVSEQRLANFKGEITTRDSDRSRLLRGYFDPHLHEESGDLEKLDVLLSAEKSSRANQLSQLESQLNAANEVANANEIQLRKQAAASSTIASLNSPSSNPSEKPFERLAGKPASEHDELGTKVFTVESIPNSGIAGNPKPGGGLGAGMGGGMGMGMGGKFGGGAPSGGMGMGGMGGSPGMGGGGRPAEFLSGGEVPSQVTSGLSSYSEEEFEDVAGKSTGYKVIDGRSRFGRESKGWFYRIPSESKPSSAEQYDPIVENRFLLATGEQALSTFSIDVDTASYSNMRHFINSGQTPPPNSVRIEELVNYFQYDYAQPKDDKPFAVQMEVAQCPWQSGHRLVRVGIKGKDVHRNERPASNLVFLLDVSGSMQDKDKLPLLQRGLQMMVDRLSENDRVSIVTYAGNAGIRLEPTSGDQKQKIRAVIDNLSANGSTNGSAGIEKAYDLAVRHFIKDGTNRVILATDGDLNVGITDDNSLVKLIKGKASEGVFLTVLGFGTGNLKDSKMEKLADNGNGVYAYIDSMREARKVLVEQMSGSLVTIAKDVKLQVEFNPAEVKAYRLLGYENRKLANADFANDRKDAGEIGAGHTVTALYEIVPTGVVEPQTLSANLKYQKATGVEVAKEDPQPKKELSKAAASGELLTLAVRYKLPEANESTRIEFVLADGKNQFYEASKDFQFAAAVASFGMLLRHSQFSGDMDLAKVEKIASEAMGDDKAGYRAEFVDLVRQFANANGK